MFSPRDPQVCLNVVDRPVAHGIAHIWENIARCTLSESKINTVRAVI